MYINVVCVTGQYCISLQKKEAINHPASVCSPGAPCAGTAVPPPPAARSGRPRLAGTGAAPRRSRGAPLQAADAGHADPCRAVPCRAKTLRPCRAVPTRAEPSRAEPHRATQPRLCPRPSRSGPTPGGGAAAPPSRSRL